MEIEVGKWFRKSLEDREGLEPNSAGMGKFSSGSVQDLYGDGYFISRKESEAKVVLAVK